ncbi:MAG: hypothetical protein U9Q69_03990 [Nanoarchaeota archaeon]|nr:hypothetical protein [Nanoarchaeota archaeon]
MANRFYSSKRIFKALMADLIYPIHLFQNEELPSGKLLYDTHHHIRRFKKEIELEQVVDAFFDRCNIVNITNTLGGPSRRACPYEFFIEDVKSLRLKKFEIKMSDAYATVINNGIKNLVFIKTQEVSCRNPYNKNHLIHINLVGHDYVANNLNPEDILKLGNEKNCIAIVNHPFSIPHKYFKFWFPKEKDVSYLEKLCKAYNPNVEEFNMMNTLWLSASNSFAKDFVKKNNLIGVGSTDAHGSKLNFTLNMIGRAGTILDDNGELNDFKNYSGKEIVEAVKVILETTEVKILNNPIDPWTFFNVMFWKV